MAGEAVAVKLAVLHAQVHADPSVESFCALSEGVNCDTVALSPHSIFASLPVAIWGVVGYALLLTVSLWGWLARDRVLPVVALTALSAVSVLSSAALGVISVLWIESLCILCMTSYLINALLLTLAVVLWRRDAPGLLPRSAAGSLLSRWRALAPLATAAAVVVGGLLLGFPRYWVQEAQAVAGDAGSAAQPRPSCDCPTSGAAQSGVTADGHPWIGASSPALTIVEFSDYQCPHCNRAHSIVRTYAQAHPGTIRLLHRHFPLDDACNPIVTRRFHPRACFYAALAVCAQEQDKFWAANDYLYLHGRDPQPVEPEPFASELGLELHALRECLEHRAAQRLREDLDAGIGLGMRGTPTFVVDDQIYVGKVPEEVLAPHIGVPSGAGSG